MLEKEMDFTGGDLDNHGFTIEALEDTLDRVANIAAGVSWQHDKDSTTAFDNISLCCVVLLYHLGVPRTLQTERAVKSSIEKAIKVYYSIASNGKWYTRSKPDGVEVIDFWSMKSKPA